MTKRTSRGVTLIELLVVMVVVGILAAIALPSYRQYVVRSHRAEAKVALLNIAASQEKFYLQCNRYTNLLTGPINGTCGTAAAPGTRGLGFPKASTENDWYSLTIPTANEASYDVTATAAGTQASDDAKCASFTIDETGEKTATSTDCWSR